MLILSNDVNPASDFALNFASKRGKELMTARRRSNTWKNIGSVSMTSDEVDKFDNPSMNAERMSGVINQLTPAMISYLPGLSEQISAAAKMSGDDQAALGITARNEVLNHSFVIGSATLRWLVANRRSQHLYSDYGLASLMIRETGTYRFGPYSGTKSSPANPDLIGLPSTPKDGAVGLTSTRYGVDITYPRYTVKDGEKVLNHAYTTGFGGRQPVWWSSNNQKDLFRTLLGFVKTNSILDTFSRITMKDLEDLYFVLSATPWWFQALIIACEARIRIQKVDRAALANTKKMVANPTLGQLWYGYYQLENSNARTWLLSSEKAKNEINRIDNIFAYIGVPQTFSDMMTKGPSGDSILHRCILFDLPWLDDLQWARCVAGVSNSQLQAYHVEETRRTRHDALGTEPAISALLTSYSGGAMGNVASPSVKNLRDTTNLEVTLSDDVVDIKSRVPLNRRITLF